jgi:DeoD family purine-nucleoside phosphorylase
VRDVGIALSLKSPAVSSPLHLRPTAELAERVLLPGDPGRALALAQTLLEGPRMFNHHRGLWGYTGTAPDGEPVTIQATGMGGPSAAIVLTELAELGALRAIRVGTCGALAPELALGDLVIASEAVCGDGTSQALGARGIAFPDGPLTHALARATPGASQGAVISVDLFYERGAVQRPERVLAVEMEAAAVFALGTQMGVQTACVLAVSDTFTEGGERRRIEDVKLLEAAERMGRAALAALGPRA